MQATAIFVFTPKVKDLDSNSNPWLGVTSVFECYCTSPGIARWNPRVDPH